MGEVGVCFYSIGIVSFVAGGVACVWIRAGGYSWKVSIMVEIFGVLGLIVAIFYQIGHG